MKARVTKHYDEPIEVAGRDLDGAPVSFSWRGRRYDVDQLVTSWHEGREWWDRAQARDDEYHRVIAHQRGQLASGELDSEGFLQRPAPAVYDLYRDRARGGWKLARVWD